MKRKLKPSEVYREAARRIAEPLAIQWTCWEIENVLGIPRHNPDVKEKDKHYLVRKYEAMFKPENSGHCWGYAWGYEERLDCRILALCFMAAIAEDEEKRVAKAIARASKEAA